MQTESLKRVLTFRALSDDEEDDATKIDNDDLDSDGSVNDDDEEGEEEGVMPEE